MTPDLDDVLVITDAPPPRRRWRVSSVAAFMVAVALVASLMAALIPAIQAAREAARRSQCVCNMCQVALALHNYHSVYDALPPAYTVDDAGRPKVSWRILLLPYMEQSQLFNTYNFDLAWDSPANLEVAKQMPSNFHCPSRDEGKREKHFTSYVMVRGPGTAFPGTGQVTFADVKDGLSNTVAIVEVDNIDIPWTAPIDLDIRTMSMTLNDKARYGPSSRHPGGINCVVLDGSKKFLVNAITPDELRAMFTIAGGEAVDPATAGRTRP